MSPVRGNRIPTGPRRPVRPAGPAGRRARVERIDTAPPVTPVVGPTGGRQVTIQGDFIGIAGATGATGGRITLTDVRTGAVTTLTRANGGIASWTPGTASTPDTIVMNVPAIGAPFPAFPPGPVFTPGPKELTIITASNNPGGGNVPSRQHFKNRKDNEAC